jgi:hypothetical protein
MPKEQMVIVLLDHCEEGFLQSYVKAALNNVMETRQVYCEVEKEIET